MTGIKKFALLSSFVLLASSLKAQMEVANLFSKGSSITGFGTFLHAGFSLHNNDELSGEVGLYYFARSGSHFLSVPVLAGYRHFLKGAGNRFYLEPQAGYGFGESDIKKTDAAGNPLYDASGKFVTQKISGPTAGLGFGYIIPSRKTPINFGLRYTHLFITGDPSQNMLSFRISWSLVAGKKAAAAK